jgi:hypothetical protein
VSKSSQGREEVPAPTKRRGRIRVGRRFVRPRICPICGSDRIIIIFRDERKSFCYDCGSRWLETILGETTVVSVPDAFPRGNRA